MCLKEPFGIGLMSLKKTEKRYDEAREEQFEMIKMRVSEVLE